MQKTASGFTIVELLIVIAVIAILAAITMVTYGGIRQRAQIASVAEGLTTVGKSFNIWMIQTNASRWPDEPTYSGGTPLSQMILNNPQLRANLQNVPSVIGVATNEWFYDNDVEESGSHGVCGNMYNGVNIVIKVISNPAIAQGVNDVIDHESSGQDWMNCGKVKYDSDNGILFYSLGYTDDDLPF